MPTQYASSVACSFYSLSFHLRTATMGVSLKVKCHKRSELLLSTIVRKSRAVWRKHADTCHQATAQCHMAHGLPVHMTYGTSVFCRDIGSIGDRHTTAYVPTYLSSTWSKPSHTASRSKLWHLPNCWVSKIFALQGCELMSGLHKKVTNLLCMRGSVYPVDRLSEVRVLALIKLQLSFQTAT